MTALNHPDYNLEIEKLNYILEYLKEYNQRIITQKGRIDKEVDYSVRHYNSDNAEQFNELILNTTLQENLKQKIKNVDKSLTKPYFARVDFEEDGTQAFQNLYIGKMSLLRDEDQELMIVDWRAPIANLYYEGRLGNASYESPDGNIKGRIQLKRQYTIEEAQLKEMYDIDITTNDDFLQASLGSSKDKRLKDIVSTIQAEQNRVIRADMWKPLIVQGAAGGGKTTIALHRIAYLLYNHENTLSPKNFMIIAPNRFFLSYISEVLPDLGVENVLQTTFEELAQDIIGSKFKIKPSHEKLSRLIEDSSAQQAETKSITKRIAHFKSSLDFMNIIQNYIRQIELEFMPKEDFRIDTFTLLTGEQIRRLFLEEYSYLPIMKRINEIKKNLVNTLRQNKGPIIEGIQFKYDRKIDEIRYKMKDSPERRKLIIEAAEKRDNLIEKIKKESKTLIREYLDKIHADTPLEYYKKLIGNNIMFDKFSCKIIDREFGEVVRVYTENILKEGFLEIEDLAPLIYIKYYINGLDEKFSVRHVLIDEAQDFSLFQLYVIKQIINSDSFTLLGDLCQGIHSYRGIQSWNQVERLIFKEGNASFLTLEQSYRTTVEIMNAANLVIKALGAEELPLAKPVIRHGDAVSIKEKSSLKEIAEEIAIKINAVKQEGFKSVAIICKTLQECTELKLELAKLKSKVGLITGGEKEYSGGTVIIPSYLVKGLEFDVVIIANASKHTYTSDELDIKLLYVAMTRPLHRLYIYSLEDKTDLLKDVEC